MVYDPAKTSYAKLLELYWHNVDPFSPRGSSAIAAISIAPPSSISTTRRRRPPRSRKRAVEAQLKKTVVPEIVAATQFCDAEEYHQDFYKKDPARYYSYRAGCGRDARLREVWGDKAGHSAVH